MQGVSCMFHISMLFSTFWAGQPGPHLNTLKVEASRSPPPSDFLACPPCSRGWRKGKRSSTAAVAQLFVAVLSWFKSLVCRTSEHPQRRINNWCCTRERKKPRKHLASPSMDHWCSVVQAPLSFISIVRTQRKFLLVLTSSHNSYLLVRTCKNLIALWI